MTEPRDAAADRLIALAAELSDEPDVTVGGGRGFGSGTLTVRGRIFAMTSNGRLVLKLPATRVAQLVADGLGEPFSAGRPRPFREWVVLADSAEDWLELGREAVELGRTPSRPSGGSR